jgi:surfactin synthase thioesterase subunit
MTGPGQEPGPGRWFIGQRPGPAPWSPRVFCFPFAGGSPRIFGDWQARLGEDAEILAVCRPGREHRAAEPPPTVTELIAGATAAITELTRSDGRPFYLFGHSLGALIAFEVCRALPGDTAPRHLIASGCAAPPLLPSRRVRDIAQLTGREFAEAVGFFGGLPADVIADDDMRELLLPDVIADFRMASGYRYLPGPPLAVPATLVVGRDDPHVRAEQVAPWTGEFSWPPELRWVDGGHFYFDGRPGVATQIIAALIRADQHVELI